MYDAKLAVEFSTEKEAEDAQKILMDAKQFLENSKDLFLHNFLYENNLDRGVQFDSMWFPQEIERHLKTLYITMVGSLSGTREQDIETWLKLLGAKQIYKEYAMFGDPCLSIGDIIGKDINELTGEQALENKLNRHIVAKFETVNEAKTCQEKILQVYNKYQEDHKTLLGAANIYKVLSGLGMVNIDTNLLPDTWSMGYPWLNGKAISIEVVTTDADARIEGFVNWLKGNNAVVINVFKGLIPPD